MIASGSMSRHSRKRRREVRDLKVNEFDGFGPQPQRITSRNVHRLMEWILWGKEADRDAMHDLFPLPGNTRNRPRV